MLRLLSSKRNANSEIFIGQNHSLTVMILNLAPVRTYHQDTLSSLNFANRTKKIEVRETENEPVFKGCARAIPTFRGTSIQRQPLRPLATSLHNSTIHASNPPNKQGDRLAKAFSVYSDGARLSNARMATVRHSPLKRPSDPFSSISRPNKRRSPNRMLFRPQPTISKEVIEKIIEGKVTDILAARALDQPSIVPQPKISEEVQKRLELLEQKIDGKDGGREQGLTFLLMAKQHAVRGEDTSALRMYTLAKDFFRDNEKLDSKIDKLREKIQQRKPEKRQRGPVADTSELDPNNNNRQLVSSDYGTDKTPPLGYRPSRSVTRPKDKDSCVQDGQADARPFILCSTLDTIAKSPTAKQDDSDYEAEVHDEEAGHESDGGLHYKAKSKKKEPRCRTLNDQVQTPRTSRLLEIVNARNLNQIRLLRGIGAKKAEAIVEALCGADEGESNEAVVKSLEELGRLRGVGPKTVENMRMGLQMA